MLASVACTNLCAYRNSLYVHYLYQYQLIHIHVRGTHEISCTLIHVVTTCICGLSMRLRAH